MHPTPKTIIGDVVAADFRAAAVFQKYAIDFCCKGNRSIADACADSGVSPDALLDELTSTCATAQAGAPRFASWELDTLAGYIVGNHHSYVRESIPVLLTHTDKIARVHGARHPELIEVAALFSGVADEMHAHMQKEEQVLFPYVSELVEASRRGAAPPASCFGTVQNPIRMMEMEHESAGAAMERIRELTGGYQPPQDACTTYRVCLQELQAFEQDLHSHVHLENNILFPKAVRLESGLRGTVTTGAIAR